MTATTIGVSLYQSQIEVVDKFAEELQAKGEIDPDKKQVRSITVRRIIADWKRYRESDSLRGVDALIAAPSPAIVDLSEGALEPFPASAAPTYWWHIDGVLVEQGGDSTSGTRVASGATAQDAADSIITACTTARGGTWQWATPPTIVRHASHRDDNCPVCKRSFATAHSYNPEENHED